MKKYPFIKQEGIKDCGPACLLMIIKYYKGYVPLEKLRDLSNTTKYGTDAYHLIEAAKELGFTARGIKCDLNQNLILPLIAHITLENNLGHYVVIYEINFKRKYIIIADPAKGISKIRISDFLKLWNNIVIELIPKRSIPVVAETSIYKFIITYLKRYKNYFLSLLVSSSFITIFTCLTNLYFKFIINYIDTSKKNLTLLLLVFILIYMFKVVIEYIKNKIFIDFKKRMDMNISCDLFSNIVELPYRYYRTRTTGEIVSRFDDLEYVRQILYRIIFSILSDLPFVIFSLILLFFINAKLTILSIIFMSLYSSLVLLINPILKKYISRIQEQGASTNSFMTEVISGFETVKNCSLKDGVKESFENKYYKLLSLDEKYSKIINIRHTSTDLIYQLGLLFVIYFGAILVLENSLSLGNLVLFYSVLTLFIEPLKNIIELDLNIGHVKETLRRILSVFIKEENKGIVKELSGNSIKINHLDFYYNDIDLILSNINLNIKKNEKVLIIGKSGSGKSTLLKILMKYYMVKNDQLFIDNTDINNYSNVAIENSVGYISQQEILFTDSIINNLGSSDMKRALEISKLCEIDSIMKSRNLNFYSIIMENGFNLSGGERQRIILGRLLLKDFKILLIDEGLSQMDVNLERRILKRIFNRYKDKTIIIVSHCTDNIDLYNHVIELSNGKIVKDMIKEC